MFGFFRSAHARALLRVGARKNCVKKGEGCDYPRGHYFGVLTD
jgi:hypothetical protein